MLFDKRYKAQPKPVYVGDKVLLKQEKSTAKLPFDPHPYNVIKVKESQITAERIGHVRVRDKNYIKVLQPRPPHLAPSRQKPVTPTIAIYGDFDIEGVITGSSPSSTPPSPPKQSSPSSATPCPLEQSFDNSLHPLPIFHHEVLEAQQEQMASSSWRQTLQIKWNPSLLESALGLQNCMETEATPSSSQKAQQFEPPTKRSKEKKLKWKPTVNSGPVVLLYSDT